MNRSRVPGACSPIWIPLHITGGATLETRKEFGTHTLFGRPGQPAERASIDVPLAASGASFSNGQIYGDAGDSGHA